MHVSNHKPYSSVVSSKGEGCFSLGNLLPARFILQTKAHPLFLCPQYFKKAYWFKPWFICVILFQFMVCYIGLYCNHLDQRFVRTKCESTDLTTVIIEHALCQPGNSIYIPVPYIFSLSKLLKLP